MRANRIEKTAEAASLAQRAEWAFALLTQADETGVRQIVNTVPMQSYRQRDAQFCDRLDKLIRAAAWWCITYWRQRYMVEALTKVFLVQMDIDQVEAARESMRLATEAKAKVSALQAGLEDCAKLGLSPEAVYRAAGLSEWELSSETKPDADYQTEVAETLAAIVNG